MHVDAIANLQPAKDDVEVWGIFDVAIFAFDQLDLAEPAKK